MVHTEPVMPAPSNSNGAAPDRLWRYFGVALLLIGIAFSSVTSVDRFAETEYQALFQRALVTFALARTLNGVISAVQGTELALQPAGVGVTLTPGEILDPVNDLVERFSWIMLGATISLGVQQVVLEIGQWWGTRVLVGALGLGWLLLRFRRRSGGPGLPEIMAFRAFFVVLLIRFAAPAVMLANDALYRLFLEDQYVESAEVVETAGRQIEEVGTAKTDDGLPEATGEAPGILESLNRTLESARDSLDLKRRLDLIADRAADVTEHLIRLSVVFILQTGLLPILFLWIFLQVFKRLLRS